MDADASTTPSGILTFFSETG